MALTTSCDICPDFYIISVNHITREVQ